MAVFDFESNCVQEDNLHDTDTTTCIVKHLPISSSVSSNLIEEPIFLTNSNPRPMIDSFVDTLDGLAAQSQTQIELKFLEIEASVKSKLNQLLSLPIEHRCRSEPVIETENGCIREEKLDVSAVFTNRK